MPDEIRIRAEILQEMLRHARRDPKIECCGLLAGRDGVIANIFPTENALASATAYEIAPMDLFQLFRRLREEGLQHLGHYHSHLHTENFPSARDIAQAYYPNEAYFIISLREDAARPVRAFLIRDGTAQELKIEIVGEGL
jgi:[CysO sulfur-carrier protein]-S-L-cysteine hydrolase